MRSLPGIEVSDTGLAESKAGDQAIMAIAGHVSKKMLLHYSHIRMDARRNALDALTMKPELKGDLGGTTKGYDTKNDTTHIVRGDVCRKLLDLWWS